MEVITNYAYLYEDVFLLHALADIDSKSIFYVDVGANDPVDESVTCLFYTRGGRGINIEPQPRYKDRYAKFRERDINLCVGISDIDGELTLHGSGTSASMTTELNDSEECIKVPVITLNEVFEKYVPEKQEVHFLKIDVEGFEENVIRGMDWSKYKPWILCIEALEQTENSEWDKIIRDNGYTFVYHDELNNWYVEEHHKDIISKFGTLDKIKDEYEVISLTDTKRWKDYVNSTSWKVTAPLRTITSALRRKK